MPAEYPHPQGFMAATKIKLAESIFFVVCRRGLDNPQTIAL
jgi:hypothetical protein